ncbi:unnamed protein product [Caenorhabditis nigoni]
MPDSIKRLLKGYKNKPTATLTCVCRERYDSGERTQHVLDCGHAVCRGCLERLVMPPQRPDLMPVLRCPICRKIGWADPTRTRPVYAMIPGALPIQPRDLEI